LKTEPRSHDWAVIGASGFIGLRAVEGLHARDGVNIRPVVRAASSLAVLARRRLDWRIADPRDLPALAEALRGCPVCIHAALGDPAQIEQMATVAYLACAAAGVRRLVWLSSASVHGQDAAPGTDESSPLHDRHPLAYNNAKVRAERRLEHLARDGRVEIVRLRPGVVYGPRSRWITDAAADLRAGRAGWLDRGRGVCNAIHVDNLVHAIRLAATTSAAGGEAFLVGDAETVTWRDFLLPLAAHLGLPASAFAELPPSEIIPERAAPLAALTRTRVYQRLGDAVPDRAKRLVKGLAAAWPAPAPARDAWTLPSPPAARLTLEQTLLQRCAWKLPHAKAARLLGYAPPVPFAAGLAASLEWLDFAEGRK
jgi:nucleoside-diphosphate-sugar epimerase